MYNKMTYKDFKSYCNERACDGKWGMREALMCITIMEEINRVKVKRLGFTRKVLTDQAQEKAWTKLKEERGL